MSGYKYVWILTCLGTNMSGYEHVWVVPTSKPAPTVPPHPVVSHPRPQPRFPHAPTPALSTNSQALKVFLSRPPPQIPRPLVLSTNQSPQADVMFGRTPRIEPSSNEGNFVKAVPILPALGSYSVNPGMSRGPVVNNSRRIVTSKRSKIPKLSPITN